MVSHNSVWTMTQDVFSSGETWMSISPSNTVEIYYYGRGGLMAYVGIIAVMHTDLHVFNRGTLNKSVVLKIMT
ncbi:hypothetical protein TNCV_2600251 [Trichonephila clavipes]|nr:hypothetical protein TNCV_2600251 [Trichonephila clavipes]